MPESDPSEEASLFPKTAGERLRESRESQGLSLAEVAARTRVPLRHLEAIEQSNYAGLPSHTYSVGFAKAYARAIGMDEVPIARDVRAQADAVPRPPEYQPYVLEDIKRQPPKGLAMTVTVVAVLVLIAAGLWYGTAWFRGEDDTAAVAPATQLVPPPARVNPEPAAAPAGQVTLTATDIVWLRIYDASGKSLFETEMKPGDRFDVPAGADHPMINVGRPDKLQVTVNGSAVPPLGDGSRAIKDVEVSAEALLARAADPAAASASNGRGLVGSALRTDAQPLSAARPRRSSNPTSAPTSSPVAETAVPVTPDDGNAPR